MSATVTVVTGYEVTVFCLCGAEVTSWAEPGVTPPWGQAFLVKHPAGVDGHGPATEEQAKEARARSQLVWAIDSCDHVWQMDLTGGHVCLRDGGCGLVLVDWPVDRPLPARGVDWGQVALTRPGRLLYRRELV